MTVEEITKTIEELGPEGIKLLQAELLRRANIDNVYDLIQERFQRDCDEGFKEYGITSYCGMECMKIAEKTMELLGMCDTHPHCVKPIQDGAICAMEVICFG